MQTVIKQAICVSVLQMCCKTRANERKEYLLSFPSAAEFIKRLCFTTKTHDKMPQKLQMEYLKNYK